MNNDADTTSALVKKVNIHPPSASRILLPDGRYLAYQEQGVPADQARFSVVAAHSFLSSRLAGMLFNISRAVLIVNQLYMLLICFNCVSSPNRNTWHQGFTTATIWCSLGDI